MAAQSARAKSTPRKTTPTSRPVSNAALARRLDTLEERLRDVETIVDSAKQRQQQAAAAKLAQNPQQLEQLKQLLAMAENVS